MIDTKPQRLAALRQQAERLPSWERDVTLLAFATADAYVEEVDRIERERYQPERAGEMTAAARATAVAGFGDVLAEIDRVVAAERERVVDDFDGERNTRAREGRQLRDVIDVDALVAADTARTVRNAVETAAVFGLDAEARQLALRVVRPKAADEQRRGRLNGEWFALLCALSGTAVTPSDRHELGQRVDARREALRALVKQIADVVGVVNALARTPQAQPAPLPENTKPSAYVAGRWFDEHPNFRR